MTSTEEWRTVDGFPDYEVSSLGRVKSYKHNKVRILRPIVRDTGYGHVSLSIKGVNNGGFARKIHRLVATAFLGPEPEWAECVRHLNGDRMDNRAENLAWATHHENMLDKRRHGTDHNVNKTHCPHGHEYTPENTIIDVCSGGRRCRTCRRAHWRLQAKRAWDRKRAAEANQIEGAA